MKNHLIIMLTKSAQIEMENICCIWLFYKLSSSILVLVNIDAGMFWI